MDLSASMFLIPEQERPPVDHGVRRRGDCSELETFVASGGVVIAADFTGGTYGAIGACSSGPAGRTGVTGEPSDSRPQPPTGRWD